MSRDAVDPHVPPRESGPRAQSSSASDPSRPAGHGLSEEMRNVQRYDLITNYRCGASIEEMEQSDDGEWVRYEDVEQALAAEHRQYQEHVEKLNLQLRTRDSQLATLLRELCPDITPYPSMNEARDRIKALQAQQARVSAIREVVEELKQLEAAEQLRTLLGPSHPFQKGEAACASWVRRKLAALLDPLDAGQEDRR